ncbi:MAG TPA: uL30 family ribosomal protein [Candidatus Nanoarchaeia archaeon]|nr:uL30 family ribosomal protein [Candidatus Nanoarchaeia archaeon]
MSMIAVVRVRGAMRASAQVHDTLRMLNLPRQNHCIVVQDTPGYRGMITKVKDYVTWGPIDDALFGELIQKRGRLYEGKVKDRTGKRDYHRWIEVGGKKYYRSFTLSPPRKGYGRNGIKRGFGAGGALGSRGEKIADLIRRMIP